MDNKYNYFITSNKMYMIIIAALILILITYGHISIGIIAVSLYGLLVVYNIKNTKHRKSEWKKFIENFSSKLDNATRTTLVKLPFPLIIVGAEGDILWYNQNFSAILKGEDILGKNIRGMIKEFNLRQALDGKEDVFKYGKLRGRYYDIYTNIVDTYRKF